MSSVISVHGYTLDRAFTLCRKTASEALNGPAAGLFYDFRHNKRDPFAKELRSLVALSIRMDRAERAAQC